MADNQASTGDRPSFATYWRTDQRTSTAKELTFVQSVPGQPSDKDLKRNQEPEQTAKDKRRAQVRRAQVQHRQRKADYVKKLEADIAGIRDKITDAERVRHVLRAENEAICVQLSGPPAALVVPGIEVTPVPQGFHVDPGFGMGGYLPLGPNGDTDGYMSTNTALDTTLDLLPCGHSGTGSPVYGSPQFMGSNGTGSPYPDLATDQPQQVMNLYLG